MIVCRGTVGGNGFGNEFLYVAKALVASLDLGLPFWKPRWPSPYAGLPTCINETSLLRHRLRYILYKSTHRFIEFNRDAYESTGEVSISKALKKFLEINQISRNDNYIIRFPQLYPEISSVVHRAEYLRSLLVQNADIATGVYQNLDAYTPGKIRVGIHIRRGDFDPALPLGQAWPEGQWNIQIPLEWYENVCDALQCAFPGQIEFFLASNSNSADIDRFRQRYECISGHLRDSRTASDVIDLLTLSFCDLHVASVSWFGFWAMAFSGKPFIWYEYAHKPHFRVPKDVQDPGAFLVGATGQLPEELLRYIQGQIAA